jgi:cathepsin D
MYFSPAFILATLPFLTAAVPLTEPPASRARGIAVPITKRNNIRDGGFVDISDLKRKITHSIMLALLNSTGCSDDLLTDPRSQKS